MTTDQPVSIIRAVLKPGVPPDCSEVTANEIITELRRAGYLIVPAAPAPSPEAGACSICSGMGSVYSDDPEDDGAECAACGGTGLAGRRSYGAAD